MNWIDGRLRLPYTVGMLHSSLAVIKLSNKPQSAPWFFIFLGEVIVNVIPGKENNQFGDCYVVCVCVNVCSVICVCSVCFRFANL